MERYGALLRLSKASPRIPRSTLDGLELLPKHKLSLIFGHLFLQMAGHMLPKSYCMLWPSHFTKTLQRISKVSFEFLWYKSLHLSPLHSEVPGQDGSRATRASIWFEIFCCNLANSNSFFNSSKACLRSQFKTAALSRKPQLPARVRGPLQNPANALESNESKLRFCQWLSSHSNKWDLPPTYPISASIFRSDSWFPAPEKNKQKPQANTGAVSHTQHFEGYIRKP